MSNSQSALITKTVRLSPDESERLHEISRRQHLSEAALMRKLILEGLERYRIETAVTAYAQGEADLSGAAAYAGISVHRMMQELRQRGIEFNVSAEKFLDGLETLARRFGGSEALYHTISEMRRQYAPDEQVPIADEDE
jgi:predicted HTH domain antitoxin